MNRPKIKCVFSDVYDTIASLSPIIAADLDRFGKTHAEFSSFIGPIAEQADHGEISFSDYQLKYSEFFGKSIDYLPLHLLPRLKPIKEVHALVTVLDSMRIPMGILSDVSPKALRQTISSGAVPYVNFFAIIESNKHGKRKTNGLIEEATKLVSERLGIQPGQILLIDDSARNIETALKHGWQAYQFNPQHPRTSIREIIKKFEII